MSDFDIAYSSLTEKYYFVIGNKKYDITEFANKKIQQGKEDAITKVRDWLKKEFKRQNNTNSKYIPTIVINESAFTFLEQMESNGNKTERIQKNAD